MPNKEWTWRLVSGALGAFLTWLAMSGQPKQEALRCALKASEAQVAFSDRVIVATTEADQALRSRKVAIVKAKLKEANQLKELTESNEEVKAWADGPVPADIVIWVRQTPNPARSSGNP